MTSGEIISLRRQELRLSLSQIAEKMNTSKSTVSKWEHDKVKSLTTDVAQRLAHILRISPLSFVKGEILPAEEDYDAIEQEMSRMYNSLTNKKKIIFYNKVYEMFKELNEEEN